MARPPLFQLPTSQNIQVSRFCHLQHYFGKDGVRSDFLLALNIAQQYSLVSQSHAPQLAAPKRVVACCAGLPPQNVTLTIEWEMLGLDVRNTSLCAPQLLGIQTKLPQEHPFGLYADGDTLSIPSGGGLWLVLTTRAHPIVDVFEIGQPLGCCTGQAPPRNLFR